MFTLKYIKDMERRVRVKVKFIGLLFLSSIILTACSTPFDDLADQINAWIAGEEVDNKETENEDTEGTESTEEDSTTEETETTEDTTETTNQVDTSTSESTSKVDYSDLYNQGEETSLDSGTYTVGEDIEAGRYEVTSDDYMGITIRNADDLSTYTDSVNGGSEDSVDKHIVFLDDDYTVEVSDYSSSSDAVVDFAPYESTEVTELTPGQWIVGEDFPAGVYDIEIDPTDSYGDLVISRQLDSNRARFLLGSVDYGGVLEVTTNLEEGELVTLNYIKSARLTKR